VHRVRAALYLVVVLAGLVEQIHARVQVVEQGLGAANLVSVNQVLLGVQRVVHGLARMVEQRGGYPLAMRAAVCYPIQSNLRDFCLGCDPYVGEQLDEDLLDERLCLGCDFLIEFFFDFLEMLLRASFY
jgi:hypothetical protein